MMKMVFGKQAKLLREMLGSAVVPDRTALEKEADEFEQYMLKKREETLARGEKCSLKKHYLQ
mgnify:CR=1 FL=1